MDARAESDVAATENRTTVERKSERELVIRRTINGPARIVFEAWSKPEIMKGWWVPKSACMTVLSWDMDVRVGGKYRLVFKHPAAPEPMAFFGSYREVTPHSRIVWTNEEAGPDRVSVTTATFEEQGGKTLLVVSELHPSKEALDEAMASGMEAGTCESYEQLEELVATLVASAGRS